MLALIAVAAVLAVPAAAPPPGGRSRQAPPRLPERLAATTESLHTAIDLWRTSGTPRPPRDLRLWALHQQRLYLALGLAPAQAGDAVVRRLPASFGRTHATCSPRGGRSSVRHRRRRCRSPRSEPVRQSRPTASRHYREAQRRFGVPWTSSPRSTSSRRRSARSARPAPPARRGRCSSCRRPGAPTASAATSTTRATRSLERPTTSAPPVGPATSAAPSTPTTTRRSTSTPSSPTPAYPPRPARVLRLPRLAGVRPNSERLPPDHEPVASFPAVRVP